MNTGLRAVTLRADAVPKRKSITVKSLDEDVPSIVKNMMSMDDLPGEWRTGFKK